MKRDIRTRNGMTALLAVGTLLAGTICAEVTGLSEVTPLDTRSLTQAVLVADGDLDSRSYTVDWSQAGRLNTEKIVGTLLLLR